jgi:hypothetical protein
VPHLARPKVFLQTGIGQSSLEVDRASIVTVARTDTVGRLSMDGVGDVACQRDTNRPTTVVVVLVAFKIEVALVFKISKFLQSNAGADLSPRSCVNADPNYGPIRRLADSGEGGSVEAMVTLPALP